MATVEWVLKVLDEIDAEDKEMRVLAKRLAVEHQFMQLRRDMSQTVRYHNVDNPRVADLSVRWLKETFDETLVVLDDLFDELSVKVDLGLTLEKIEQEIVVE